MAPPNKTPKAQAKGTYYLPTYAHMPISILLCLERVPASPALAPLTRSLTLASKDEPTSWLNEWISRPVSQDPWNPLHLQDGNHTGSSAKQDTQPANTMEKEEENTGGTAAEMGSAVEDIRGSKT